jgi:hypothetical protein
MMRPWRVVPIPWFLLGIGLIGGAIEGFVLYTEWRIGRPVPLEVRPGVLTLRALCFFYGVYRVTRFHPYFHPGYCRWLASTPWVDRKPLPLGPVHLVWQDAFVLVPLALLSLFQVDLDPLTLVPVLMGGYLVLLSLTFIEPGLAGFAYALAFGLGLLVRLWPIPWACALAAVGSYLVGYVGLRCWLRKSLRVINLSQLESPTNLSESPTEPALDRSGLGWPFNQLGPKWLSRARISSGHAVVVSLLAGWWLYACAALVRHPMNARQLLSVVAVISVSGVVAGRTALYCNGYAAPISFWGRVWTLRWIIPGYDQVFLGPVLALLGGLFFLRQFDLANLDALYAFPIAMSFALFVALAMPPSLKAWRLTGNHRIVGGPSGNSNKPLVRVG